MFTLITYDLSTDNEDSYFSDVRDIMITEKEYSFSFANIFYLPESTLIKQNVSPENAINDLRDSIQQALNARKENDELEEALANDVFEVPLSSFITFNIDDILIRVMAIQFDETSDGIFSGIEGEEY